MRDLSEQGPRLPAADFATIAVDLSIFASQANEAVNAWQIMAARGGLHSPGVEHTVQELVASARRADQIKAFFVAMIPHEELMRDFVAGLATGRQDEAPAQAVG